MTISSESAEIFTISRFSRCWRVRSVPSVSMVSPMIPFIGVRTSWLTLARNSLFARFAASAASMAWCSFSSVFCRSSSSAISEAECSRSCRNEASLRRSTRRLAMLAITTMTGVVSA
jgi:hypothetical protein